MNEPQISQEQVDAVEKVLKKKHGGKLPFLFIVFYAALCAGLEMLFPSTSYADHFLRLTFFGWFSWFVASKIAEAVNRWKNE